MKNLTINSYHELIPYIRKAQYDTYHFNFICMMMWNHEYPIQYQILEDYAVIGYTNNNQFYWMMPLTTPQYYNDAIDYMLLYCEEHHIDFIMECMSEEFKAHITDYNNKFIYKRTEWCDDYIYSRSLLENLNGKKMQKRRNHFNAFIKQNPTYQYKELDPIKNQNEIMYLLSRWQDDKEDNHSIISEQKGIETLLSYNNLDYKIGGLYINNQLEAMIIGSLLNEKTIHIHVEKANPHIRGLYPAILKLFLEHNYQQALYINREDDLGLENLRKAKNALHPIRKIHKYQAQLKKFSIQQNTVSQKELQDLWLKSFDDENEVTAQYYFDTHYPQATIYALYNKNSLISVGHVYQHEMLLNDKIQPYIFIVGVATKKEYQGQGCMKHLIEYIKNQYQYPIYLQAYNPHIYEKIGFHITYYQQVIQIDKQKYKDNYSIQEVSYNALLLLRLYQAYTTHLNGYRIRDIKYYEKECYARISAYNEQIKAFKINNTPIGYIIYSEQEKVYIHEFIYINNKYAYEMLKYICQNFAKDIIVQCDLIISIEGNKSYRQNMLTNLSNKIDQETLYINEIY